MINTLSTAASLAQQQSDGFMILGDLSRAGDNFIR
jgi:hypothetical protein